MSHTCPQCGFEIEEPFIEECEKCHFNFNDTLTCPYKFSMKCVFDQKECIINGLVFEDCSTYLKNSGIRP